jgi:hypothetical protein
MSPAPFPYLRACVLIASTGCCVADLELLSLSKELRNGIFVHTAYLSAHPIVRYVRRALGPRRSECDYPLTVTTVASRLAASLLIAVSAMEGKLSLAGLSIFVGTSVLIQVRGGLGNNGSDDMLLLVLFVGFWARLLNTPLSATMVLLFISAQMSLAYLASGLVKVSQLTWRNGTSMIQLMATETFGHPGALAALKLSGVVAAITSTVFVFGELFGTLAPWLPPPYALTLLCCALVFHLATAIVMGLNTFVPAFAATFPAALYTSHLLYAHAR